MSEVFFTIWKRWSWAPKNLAQPANQKKYPTQAAAEKAIEELKPLFSDREFFIKETRW